MTADGIARALGGRRSGGGWQARCPVHENDGERHNPSLSIGVGRNGGAIIKCHAGCSQTEVIEALKARGLWESAEDSQTGKRIKAIYGYTDERGELLYEIVRFEPKDFRQRYPDSHGGFVWKKHPQQVLYHLPEVLEAPIVFLVEGERDVETLRSWGFAATTNAGGAKAPWLPQFTEALAGREVVLIPDNDEPGRARVLTIARALLGTAARLILLEMEGAKDITDWFNAGHSEVELIAAVEGQEVNQ
jgi:putative DNA primase/helicase